jgi:undecaprenyl-diphosphatase
VSVVLCLLLIAASAVPVALGRVPAVDRAVRSWTEAHQGRRAFAVLDAVTRLAHWPWVCVALIVVAGAVAIARSTMRPLRQALLSVVLLVVVTWVLKAAAGRPGPTGVEPWPWDGAWPSGHATAVVVATVVVLGLFPAPHAARLLTVAVAFVPAALLSFALVYCGHHWFTDVAVAFPLGLLLFWGASAAEDWSSRREHPAPYGSQARGTSTHPGESPR